MLKRYTTDQRGKMIPIAKIYTEKEHPIERKMIDGDAAAIASRLRSAGFEAYIVGGAVRDLLQGKNPKDFDISTSARPRQIKKLFRNSRIIGRRFRLVHIHFSGGKIIEVSTFRADDEEGNSNNVFGSLEEDVQRRDFSINALYLDPNKMQIIDFVDGVKDVHSKKMRSLIPLERTFKEDPVRMIRAVKYSCIGGFKMRWRLQRAIAKHVHELARCPSSRMTEEVFKVLSSGRAEALFLDLEKRAILPHMLPRIDSLIKNGDRDQRERFFASLRDLDIRVNEKDEKRKGTMLMALLSPFVRLDKGAESSSDLFMESYKSFKQLLEPITPPNYEVEMAVVKLFRKEGLRTPKNVGMKPRSTAAERSGGQDKEKSSRKRRNRRRRRRPSSKQISEKQE